eukprot:scaffold1323_cov160-Amphora_coffeaeformis.AAC.18
MDETTGFILPIQSNSQNQTEYRTMTSNDDTMVGTQPSSIISLPPFFVCWSNGFIFGGEQQQTTRHDDEGCHGLVRGPREVGGSFRALSLSVYC